MENHSFDWNGFSFASKIILVTLLLGAVSHYGTVYTYRLLTPTQQPTFAALIPTAEASTRPDVTPERVIESLTIAQVVPASGKFIAADLVEMKLYLYKDGYVSASYPIKTKGRIGTPWETPAGFYSIKTKEESHFSSIGKVYMPYSMQFYGNYFIHGWTYYPDGTLTTATFSGGCIKLSVEDSKAVFEFADVGTKVFVYDARQHADLPTLTLPLAAPAVAANSYLVADIDTGDVYAERNATAQQSPSAAGVFLTALVANEIISLDKKVSINEGALFVPEDTANTLQKTFLVDDLFYPLLMQSSPTTAKALASYYGPKAFVRWINATARALDMASTTYADPAGLSPDSTTTLDDLYRLTRYVNTKKSFVLTIASSSATSIDAVDGSSYDIINTGITRDTVSVASFTAAGSKRKIAIIVLGSNDLAGDKKHLVSWARSAITASSAACVSCTEPHYRKINP